MSEKIRVLVSEEEIEKRILQMAKDISEFYQGEPVHLVSVLKGGVFFTCELAKRLTIPVSSYLMDNLKSRKPKSLHLCTLLDKPERRVTDVHVDYTGFEIPDEFVVGYGLDYMQHYRNLPYIGVVELDA